MINDAQDYQIACAEFTAAQAVLEQMTGIITSARVLAREFPSLAARLSECASQMEDLASDLRADLTALREACAAWERRQEQESGEPATLTGADRGISTGRT